MLDRVVVGSNETRFFFSSYGWDDGVRSSMDEWWVVRTIVIRLMDYGQLIILKKIR